MPPKSPLDIIDPTVRFSVKINGDLIKDYYPIVSINITHELNKISFAEIIFLDGSVEAMDFPISGSDDLVPGNYIEIAAGYGKDAETLVFTGLIVKQSIRIDNCESPKLVIT